MRKYLPDRLISGSFTSNVLTLMIGTSIAQVIPILISPVLTRLYKPEDFAVFALFTAMASILFVVATARYELAVMLPKDEDDSFNLLFVSISVAVIFSISLFIIFWLFNNKISSLLANPIISQWLYWIPLFVLLTGIFLSLNYWFSRKKLFKELAISRIAQSASAAIISVGLGILIAGPAGLIIGIIIGQGLATAILSWRLGEEDRALFKVISWQQMRRQIIKYKDFPTINSIHAFLDMLQVSGLVFLISAFFGDTILGLYALTMRVLKVPVNFISKSVGQVFFQHASDIYNKEGDLHSLVRKTIIRLGMMALPVFTIVFLLAPYLFEIIFGKEWREAGVYAKILSPWIFLNFITSPISQIPLIVNKQKIFLLIGVFYNFMILLIIVFSGQILNDIKTGFYLLSFTMSLILIFFIFWLLKISRKTSTNSKMEDQSEI